MEQLLGIFKDAFMILVIEKGIVITVIINRKQVLRVFKDAILVLVTV